MSYSITHNAFSAVYCDEIEAVILKSPYLGKSPLGPEFVETRGFSIVFTRDALGDVLSEFPFLESFVEHFFFSRTNTFFQVRERRTGRSLRCQHWVFGS